MKPPPTYVTLRFISISIVLTGKMACLPGIYWILLCLLAKSERVRPYSLVVLTGTWKLEYGYLAWQPYSGLPSLKLHYSEIVSAD